jgi:hypothetical protein
VTEVTPWLSVRSGAVIHLWMPAEWGAFRWEWAGETAISAVLASTGGRAALRPCPADEPVTLAATGSDDSFWELRLTAPDGTPPGRVRLRGEGLYPFLLPGPGIVPSHFPIPEPALRLAANGPFTCWCDVPDRVERLTVQALLPAAALPALHRPDGSALPLHWRMPRSSYRVAEVGVGGAGGWWALPVRGCRDDARLTTYEGLPLFLLRPPERFPYVTLAVDVTDGRRGIAARVQALRDERLVALRDLLPGERTELHVPPGRLTVTASAGIQYAAVAVGRAASPGEHATFTLPLTATLTPEPGWYAGDHHMHSYFEDGGQAPEAVVRAARAEGLAYLFLTDVPEPLLEAGLQRHNVPGEFLALPGQEVVNPAVHCNALNTRRTLPCPEYGDNTPGYPGPPEWLAAIAQQQQEGQPATLMLNHPSHRPESAARHPYFRAWWVADAHPEIRLVENFDLPSWYARLNQGRRLVGLWTTDTHDVVFIPPGARRTYVHVPGELTEATLLAALEAGRCFNTRHPGALLYLTVDGAGPGETARTASDEGAGRLVQLRCQSNRPLQRLDLVCQGAVVRRWSPAGATWCTVEERLAVEGWVLALAYAEEAPPSTNGHTGTPLDVDGCIAFTNPVWLQRS